MRSKGTKGRKTGVRAGRQTWGQEGRHERGRNKGRKTDMRGAGTRAGRQA